jgi:hypothetical protein
MDNRDMDNHDAEWHSQLARTSPLPSDFLEFLTLDLALPREHAQRTLVELMRDYLHTQRTAPPRLSRG